MNESTATQLNPYLDPKRFPLTTQGDLDLHDQRLIDAINTDALREMREHGRPLDAEQEAIERELAEKAALPHGPAEPVASVPVA